MVLISCSSRSLWPDPAFNVTGLAMPVTGGFFAP
jgi:hypothetical protein